MNYVCDFELAVFGVDERKPLMLIISTPRINAVLEFHLKLHGGRQDCVMHEIVLDLLLRALIGNLPQIGAVIQHMADRFFLGQHHVVVNVVVVEPRFNACYRIAVQKSLSHDDKEGPKPLRQSLRSSVGGLEVRQGRLRNQGPFSKQRAPFSITDLGNFDLLERA